MKVNPLHAESPGSIAYFWHIHELAQGQRTWWHNGMTGCCSSYMAFDPERKVGMVALYNQAHGAFTPRCMEILDGLFH